MRAIFLAIFLAGCANLPPSRPMTTSEEAVVEELRATWGDNADCPAIDPGRARVWVAPQALVSDYCTGGRSSTSTMACTSTVYEHAFDLPGRAQISISWDLGWESHHHAVAHEAAHHLAACVLGHSDRHHTRSDLWVDAVYGANARFLEAYPVEAPDPYEVPGPPWDLSGTDYEGADCTVQPPGYAPPECQDGGM